MFSGKTGRVALQGLPRESSLLNELWNFFGSAVKIVLRANDGYNLKMTKKVTFVRKMILTVLPTTHPRLHMKAVFFRVATGLVLFFLLKLEEKFLLRTTQNVTRLFFFFSTFCGFVQKQDFREAIETFSFYQVTVKLHWIVEENIWTIIKSASAAI